MVISKRVKQLMKILLVVFMSVTMIVPDGFVKADTDYLILEKTQFEPGEPINVTLSTDYQYNGYIWIALYNKGDVPGDGPVSIRYLDNSKHDLYSSNNILNGLNDNNYSIPVAGRYDIILMYQGNPNDYYNVVERKTVQIGEDSEFEIEKNHYKYGEPVSVHSSSAWPSAWVGLYEAEHHHPLDKEGYLLDWYYVSDNDTEGNNKFNKAGDLPVGHYAVILFTGGWAVDEDDDGELILGSFSIDRTYEDPTWEISEDETEATATFKPTDPDGEDLVETVETTITNTATCSDKGVKTIEASLDMGEKFVSVSGETSFTYVKEEVSPALGHEWGEPTWKWVGHKSATAEFTCKNDPSHKVTIVADVTTETDNYSVTATATVKAPNGKVYTDVKTESELDDNMKFRLKVSSREGEARGSVTGTVYSDYHADIVVDGELVNENNLKVEMWMHNVGSLGVEGLRYYGTEFTPSSADKPHSLDTIRVLFDELCDGTTSITGKIDDKSVKYTFVKTNTRDKYEVKPDSGDNARDVWHELFNEDTVEALTEESDDSKITITKGSYLMIGEDRLQFEEGKDDLVIDNLGDIAAMDAAVRDHVELVSEEGNTTVEVFLDKGSVVKVGQSYVKLLKEVKAVIDIDPAALEGELENLQNPAEGTNLVSNFFGLIVKVLGEVEGNDTTVEFRFGHKMNKTEKVEATCTEEGSEEYWTCEVCGRMFADEEGKDKITEPAVIAALGHDLVHHEAAEATCAKEGNKEYWECSRCGKLFSDKDGNTEVTKEEVIIPLVEHKLVHHEAVEPECEKEGNKEYWECSECGKLFSDKEGKTEIKKEDTVVAAKGHDWGEPEYKWSADNTEVTATRVCKNDKEHVETETVKTTAKVTKEATCEEKGETTYTAAFKNEAFKKQEKVVADIEATGHKWIEPEWKWNEDENGVVSAVATFVCANDPKHVVEEKAEVTSTVTGNTITHEAVVKGPDGKEYMAIVKTLRGDVVRIFGNDRYETGLKAAEFLADIQGVEKFDNVVLTTGQNFPDALSGAYLARTLDAPILLIKEEAKDKVQKYIKEHLNEGGEILVLGGENAVKEEWLGDLGKQFKVSRVRGDTRYLTNIDILNKVDYKGRDILVCTGKDYADSLSGSAVNMPILLVNDALTKEQTEYLSKIEGIKFHIVGGTSAVSAAVEKELAKYGEVVERFAGETRYETSTLLAEAFFEDAMQAVLAYGVNFPDGLCGGVIAAKMGAPLIVTISGDRRSYAADYCGERSISSGAVLGGSGLIDDVSVRKIFMMNDKDEIVIYERE